MVRCDLAPGLGPWYTAVRSCGGLGVDSQIESDSFFADWD